MSMIFIISVNKNHRDFSFNDEHYSLSGVFGKKQLVKTISSIISDLIYPAIISQLFQFWKSVTLHYRLRCPIGFWNEQKVDKSICLFLSQKTPLNWRKWVFDQNMTQMLYQKSFITFSENKYGQNHGQCSERVEGGLTSAEPVFWYGENIHQVEKKISK